MGLILGTIQVQPVQVLTLLWPLIQFLQKAVIMRVGLIRLLWKLSLRLETQLSTITETSL